VLGRPLYREAESRLCVNYLEQGQWWTGNALVVLAFLLGGGCVGVGDARDRDPPLARYAAAGAGASGVRRRSTTTRRPEAQGEIGPGISAARFP
jgi:hypothetical protein